MLWTIGPDSLLIELLRSLPHRPRRTRDGEDAVSAPPAAASSSSQNENARRHTGFERFADDRPFKKQR